MNSLPRTIKHPLVGDEVTFVKTSKETFGEYSLLKVVLQPGGGTDLHYHTRMSEKFDVVQGRLGLRDEKQTIYLNEGESYTIAPNRLHRFFNDTDQPIVFYCTVSPAGRFEDLLRIAYGLATDQKTNKKGIPKNLWHAAMMFKMGESYLPGVPIWPQKGVFNALAAVGKWRGEDVALEKYVRGSGNEEVGK